MSSHDHDLATGENRIQWARAHMPILRKIRDDFARDRPFEGMTIGVCLHLEAKTAVWFDALVAGGARIVATGSPGTTQDDTAAVLNAHPDIVALGERAESFEDHLRHCRTVLRAAPDLIADNGGDLHGLVASEAEFAPLKQTIIGATEETTTGGFRLREDLAPFEFATWIINDTMAKRIIENRYGVGSSVVDGIMRATNVMLHGKTIVVIGYGYCGSGVAQRMRGMGARVVVVDRDPMRRLEAHMEGFETRIGRGPTRCAHGDHGDRPRECAGCGGLECFGRWLHCCKCRPFCDRDQHGRFACGGRQGRAGQGACGAIFLA